VVNWPRFFFYDQLISLEIIDRRERGRGRKEGRERERERERGEYRQIMVQLYGRWHV
jgi:hypothetical protein